MADNNPGSLTQPWLLKQIRANAFPNVPLDDPSTQMRLLSLLPAAADEPLCCDVSRYPLLVDDLECPYFEALSYTWGTSFHSTICVNDVEGYIITDNLAAALRRLRRPERPRMLWVDAICIDQTDLPERNAQVSIMHRIYARAARVTVWLGEPPSGTVTPLAYSDWSIVTSLAAQQEHAWWRRTWTVQEAAVAKDLLVHYGELAMPWSTFVYLFKAFPHPQIMSAEQSKELRLQRAERMPEHQRNWSEVDLALDILATQSAEMDEALFCAKAAISAIQFPLGKDEQQRSLRDWLWMTGQRVATDPRDNIFGLLAITVQAQEPAMLPDYSKSMERVFMEAVCSVVSSTGTLEIITGGWPADIKGCPWVPNFGAVRLESHRTEVARYSRYGDTDIRYGVPIIPPQVRGTPKLRQSTTQHRSQPCSPTAVPVKPRLEVEGLHVGYVCAVVDGPLLPAEDVRVEFDHYTWDFLANLHELYQSPRLSSLPGGLRLHDEDLVDYLARFNTASGTGLPPKVTLLEDIYLFAATLFRCIHSQIDLLGQVHSGKPSDTAIHDLRYESAPREIKAANDIMQSCILCPQSHLSGPKCSDAPRATWPFVFRASNYEFREYAGYNAYLSGTMLEFESPHASSERTRHGSMFLGLDLNGVLDNTCGYFDPLRGFFANTATNVRLEDGSILKATLHWTSQDGEDSKREASIDLQHFVWLYRDFSLRWCVAHTPFELVYYRAWVSILSSIHPSSALMGDTKRSWLDIMMDPKSRKLPDCIRQHHPHELSVGEGYRYERLMLCKQPELGWLLDWLFALEDECDRRGFPLTDHIRMQRASIYKGFEETTREATSGPNGGLDARDLPDEPFHQRTKESTRLDRWRHFDAVCRKSFRNIDIDKSYRSNPLSAFHQKDPETLQQLLEDRKIFLTAEGLIGFGPQSTQLGDEVALACGAMAPYILRPNGDVTDLVGEAYVIGLMEGEMFQLHEEQPQKYPLVDLVTAAAFRMS